MPSEFKIALSFSGRTLDSDSSSLGSIPSGASIISLLARVRGWAQ